MFPELLSANWFDAASNSSNNHLLKRRSHDRLAGCYIANLIIFFKVVTSIFQSLLGRHEERCPVITRCVATLTSTLRFASIERELRRLRSFNRQAGGRGGFRVLRSPLRQPRRRPIPTVAPAIPTCSCW